MHTILCRGDEGDIPAGGPHEVKRPQSPVRTGVRHDARNLCSPHNVYSPQPVLALADDDGGQLAWLWWPMRSIVWVLTSSPVLPSHILPWHPFSLARKAKCSPNPGHGNPDCCLVLLVDSSRWRRKYAFLTEISYEYRSFLSSLAVVCYWPPPLL